MPPRTPERDEEPPPMTLLNQLGLPENIKMLLITTTEMTYL